MYLTQIKNLLSKVAIVGIVLTGFTTQPAQAGWGNFVNSLSDLDPTNPNSKIREIPRGVATINFIICNNTGHQVYFNLNNLSKSMNSGYCTTFSDYPQGTDLAFDKFYSNGYQREYYDMYHGGRYAFNKLNNNQGIDLNRN